MFKGFGEVWFDSRALTNILSLKHVKEMFRVTYDSNLDDGAFVVHKPNGLTNCFVMHKDGLHYFDIHASRGRTRSTSYGITMTSVDTVSMRMDGYSK